MRNRTKKKPVRAKAGTRANPLRLDPARLGPLRRELLAQLKKRFARVRLQLATLVGEEDAFGLRGPAPGNPLAPFATNQDQRWRFLSVPERLKLFSTWLDDVIQREIIGDGQWWLDLVNRTYVKGLSRAYDDVKKAATRDKTVHEAQRRQFISAAMTRPIKPVVGNARYAELFGPALLTLNVFCPTGEGGGIDPTCSPDGGGAAQFDKPGKTETSKFFKFDGKAAEKYRITKATHTRGTVQEVKIAGLVATQKTVENPGVKEFLNDPAKQTTGGLAFHGVAGSLPLIVQEHDGRRLILDGHHRLIAAAVRGEKTVKARVIMAPPPTVNAFCPTGPGGWVPVRNAVLRGAGGRFVTERVHLLALRFENELAGATTQMAQRVARDVSEGMSRGTSPTDLAATIADSVDVSIGRAGNIARTEISRWQAEAQLDAFDDLGVENVNAAVEWVTSDDPCPRCEPLAGVVLTVAEARGLIPRHPNCYCVWLPLPQESDDQIRGRKAIEGAIRRSADAGDDNFDEGVSIARRRPELASNNRRRHVPGVFSQETLRMVALLDQYLRGR